MDKTSGMMIQRRSRMANHRMTLISLFAIGFAGINALALPVSAEMYVAGTAGVNFADRINSIAGTGSQAGVPGPFVDFDLQNSITYGAKVGYFPGHSWIGIEGEVLHTTPHIKQLDSDPGIHMRVTTIGAKCYCTIPRPNISAVRRCRHRSRHRSHWRHTDRAE